MVSGLREAMHGLISFLVLTNQNSSEMMNANKIFHFTLLSFFLSFSTLIFSQNLIPNSGFEEWDGTSGSGGTTLSGLDLWYQANGTADHHHVDLPGNNLTGLEPCPLGQGNTWCGYPVEGDAVLGCWKGNGLDGTREWAGVELTEPMEAGTCYKVSFWVQNKKDDPDNLYETNQWGIFFSETMLPTFSPDAANYTNKMDHIVMTEEVVGDTIWHYFEFDYTASEDFFYAFVGFMGNVSEATYTVANNSPNLGIYAWFDELSVTRIEPTLTVSEDASICVGDSILVEASSNFPIIWEHLGTDTINSFWVKPTETTSYFVQTQDSTQCSIIDTVTITINPDIMLDFPEVVCKNAEPIELNSFYNEVGTWSGDGITNAATGLFNPQNVTAGLTEVSFQSSNHCSENFTLLIEVDEAPVIDFQADNMAGCAPVNVEFTNLSNADGVEYLWNYGNGVSSNEATAESQIYDQNGEYDVQLSVIYSEYCYGEQTYENLIRVVDAPNANFSFSPNAVTNLNPEVELNNTSSTDATFFLWNFGDGKTSTNFSPTYEYPQPGVYDVQLFASNPEGCTDSITQQLIVGNEVNFHTPNVFSPNYDGTNDLFQVFSIGNLSTFQLTIFDRWGGLVFQSHDVDNSWDGSHQRTGEVVKEGVYAFVIEYSYENFVTNFSSKDVVSGDVMVVR